MAATTGTRASPFQARGAAWGATVQLAALQTPWRRTNRRHRRGTPSSRRERVAPNAADLTAERDTVEGEVLSQKQSSVWEGWMAGTMASAKVERFGKLGAPLPRRG